MSQVESIVMFVNDLLSYCEEYDEPRDQTGLINKYCHVEGISLPDEELNELTCDAMSCCEQLAVVIVMIRTWKP